MSPRPPIQAPKPKRDLSVDSETGRGFEVYAYNGAMWLVLLPAAGVGAFLAWIVSRHTGQPFSWGLTILFGTFAINAVAWLLRKYIPRRTDILWQVNLSALFLAAVVWVAEYVSRH